MGLRGEAGDLFAEDPFGRAAPREEPAARVVSVSELTRLVKSSLEALGRVRVEGEITRVTRAASGHVYFDLKDLDAKIACTIWRSALASAARFELEEGLQVVAHGKLDVYGPRGTYSLNVSRLEQRGLGAQLAELERLKTELSARGWFDRKRPLPELPALVGVVTSRDGAALQDFLRTRALRWPLYPARLAHTSVQGKDAAREIAAAIRRLDASGVDVLVVIRGGGSLEDLWCFNELPVAEAVWNTRVPVVSGVGHQTDTTLVDLVADHRAHTPTDAAQTVIPDRSALVERLESARANLEQTVSEGLATRAELLARLARSRALRDASVAFVLRGERLARQAQGLRSALERTFSTRDARCERARSRLDARSPGAELSRRAERLARFPAWFARAQQDVFDGRERALAVHGAALAGLSPLRVLERGYSITRRAGDTAALRGVAGLARGDVLETTFADGRVRARAEEILPEPPAAEDGAARERAP